MSVEKILIAANFTIEPVGDAVGRAFLTLGREIDVEFAPFNQIFQQLLSPVSLFRQNPSGTHVIFLKIDDLIDTKEKNFRLDPSDLAGIQARADEFINALHDAPPFARTLTVVVCPLSRYPDDPTTAARLAEIAAGVISRAGDVAGCQIIDATLLGERYQLAETDNPGGRSLAQMPYTPEAYEALGLECARWVDMLLRDPFKVLVLDCDNTLWDGVVGEAGVDGIGFSANRMALQRFARKAFETGVLLCLCSKNNEDDVWEVFEKRTELLFRRDQITAAKINWSVKSENIKSLAAELNLGLDSFVFVDDDHAVCAEVRLNCPQVLTVQLPDDSRDLSVFLDHLWVFDKLRVTAEDRNRTLSYQQQVQRQQIQASTSNITEFLASLELRCAIEPIAAVDVARVSQLSLRTNQFNSTTLRLSEEEVRQLIADGDVHGWSIRVTDKFGDYGLVGVVFSRIEKKNLRVFSFMLSCRVLGRGVEYKITEALGALAGQLGADQVVIEFAPSAKNKPFAGFLEDLLGGLTAGDNILTVDLAVAASEILARRSADANAVKTESEPKSTNEQSRAVSSDRQGYTQLADFIVNGRGADTILRSVVERTTGSHQAADTATEKRLVEIWESVLKLDGIGIDDDFFQLGGDSLAGVTVFVEIETSFGRMLPLSSLISAPTIRQLARLIDANDAGHGFSYLVPISGDGEAETLYCMHAAGGNVLFYRDLATELGTACNVYGLQARGVSDKSLTAHDNVEEMAADYLAEIRRHQPFGPYRLCGSSFGGLVAFEAARQLIRDGETVALVALFDTYAPGYLKQNKIETRRAGNSLRERFTTLSGQLSAIDTIGGKFRFIGERLGKLRTKLKRRVAWKKNEFAIQYSRATGRELPPDVQRNHRAIQTALNNYNPAAFQGNVVLFRATEQPADVAFDEFLGWRNFVGGEIKVEEVTGSHGAVTVYPFASDLAVKLKPYLETGEQNARTAAVVATAASSAN